MSKERLHPTLQMEPVRDSTAWVPSTLADSEWKGHLTEAHLEELDRAIKENEHKVLEEINQDSSSMATLSPMLKTIAEKVNDGRGFYLLRGFPSDSYTSRQCQVAMMLINSHFGIPISQNKYGDKILDVKSEGRKLGEYQVRGYDTDSELRFHNDESDIISLMCLHPAKEGGLSSVVSSSSIYNVIREECPEHLDVLFNGYIFSLMGEERPGVGPVSDHRIPVFSFHAGKLSCRYTLNTIFQANKITGVPLTDEEKGALDVVLEIANRPGMHLDFYMRKGDLQFINNLSVLHSRSAFVDYDEESKRRRLLRVWLCSYNPRPLVPEFEERYNDGWSFRKGIPVSASR